MPYLDHVMVREGRLRLNKSREQAAAEVGCSVDTLRNWERPAPHQTPASEKHIAKLSEVLGIPVEVLMRPPGEQPSKTQSGRTQSGSKRRTGSKTQTGSTGGKSPRKGAA